MNPAALDQSEQIHLVRRVLAHLEARTTDMVEHTATQPARHYDDPSRYAAEIEALFRPGPLAVAHVSAVAEPGDHFTTEIGGEIGGRSILVVRGEDGQLYAHLNVCRHRGSRLVEGAGGKGCTRFSCPYHGWTYAADGRLVGLPHRKGFPGVDADSHALASCAVAEYGGLVWLGARSGAGPLDVEAFLGPDVAGLLHSQRLAEHHVYAPRTVARGLDWKLAIDIFLEAYHLRSAHADSIFPMFFDNVGLVDFFGPHQRGVFPKRTIATLAERDPQTWRLRDHANVLLHVFPNTLVLFEPDHMAVLHVAPTGPGRCEVRSYTLVPEAPNTDKARRYWDANNAILYGATDEDFERGESIQAGITSGANDVLTFGRFEHGLAHFHREIGRRVDG
jgi:phenylpropionate dioxygenase-like ring-hydroxylating dioxygenase large terminal subunit